MSDNMKYWVSVITGASVGMVAATLVDVTGPIMGKLVFVSLLTMSTAAVTKWVLS